METKERETKEFTTKGGHIIVYKTYLTGRESNEIQKVLLKDVKLEVGTTGQNISGFNANNVAELNNKTIELLVVSVDGKKEKVLDIILDDMPSSDYTEIIAELNKATEEKKN